MQHPLHQHILYTALAPASHIKSTNSICLRSIKPCRNSSYIQSRHRHINHQPMPQQQNQGWEFPHSLKLAQDKWAAVSNSLRSLRTNDRPWAHCSGRSWQKSDCKQFAQVAHSKRANEQIAPFFSKLLICRVGHPFFLKERSDLCVLFRSI